MNQEKIGKLIANLRKKKGLTQSELGALVGVGDRAVSKWERGLTCPDISIINGLSRALGITSDELLAGEVNGDNETKVTLPVTTNSNNNKKILLIPIFLIIALIATLLYINYAKSDVYTLKSVSDEYSVVGKVIFKNNKMSLIINSIAYEDKNFREIIVKNYEYNIKCDNDFLYQRGSIDDHYLLLKNTTVAELSNHINIDYDIDVKISKRQIIKNGLTVNITFLDDNNYIIARDIKILLYK